VQPCPLEHSQQLNVENANKWDNIEYCCPIRNEKQADDSDDNHSQYDGQDQLLNVYRIELPEVEKDTVKEKGPNIPGLCLLIHCRNVPPLLQSFFDFPCN
jgi:hypothetical protein